MTSEVVFLFLLLLLQIRMKSRTSRTMAQFLVSFLALTRGPAHGRTGGFTKELHRERL